MMGNFSDYFDQKEAERRAALKAERDAAAAKAEAKANLIEAMSSKLKECFYPVMQQAEKELSIKNIKVEMEPFVSTEEKRFIFSTYFRLLKSYGAKGRETSETYGFRILSDPPHEGFIQGAVVDKVVNGRGRTYEISCSEPNKFGELQVQELIYAAIKDLADKVRY